jgi:hypothetical protein
VIRQALAVLVLAMATDAFAQVALPYGSMGLRGQVVDAESGRPVQGAVVVATWAWLDYEMPGYYRSGGYRQASNSLHVGEGVSDGGGNFRVPAWALTKSGGRLDENQPRIFAFKAGYEPLKDLTTNENMVLRMKKAPADPKEYARQIAALQGGLRWLADETAAKSMPRMMLALHDQKARLGEDGAEILGGHRMPGRAGKGSIVDAATDKPGPGGVVWVEWTMRRSDGAKGSRQIVETKRSGEPYSTFFVSPWRLPGPRVAGWEIDPTIDPKIRIYPYGAKRSRLVHWGPEGDKVPVEKVPESREAVLAELRAWRKDIDGQLAQGNREEALVLQQELLSSFDQQCQALTPDLRLGLCFDADSDVSRAVYALRHQKVRVDEYEGGVRVITTNADSPKPSFITTSPPRPAPTNPVSGFTIEPKQ